MFLLHDDIEDEDTMRRDQPTVWVKYGVANAINAGDYLLARAYHCILISQIPSDRKLKLLEIFNLTYEKTVEGQALDINARGATDYTVEKYLELVRLKTGYYLACGMVGGAVVASGNIEGTIDKIWALGKLMGPAFQIKDDLIDLTVGKGRGGVIGSDIKEGKASFLYAYTLEIANDDDKASLIEIMTKQREETTDDDVQSVLNIYNKHGAIEHAQEYADDLIKQTYDIIDEIPTDNKAVFRDIANFMAQRMT
jgi:geranylgeranyl pyrophosphate synthase